MSQYSIIKQAKSQCMFTSVPIFAFTTVIFWHIRLQMSSTRESLIFQVENNFNCYRIFVTPDHIQMAYSIGPSKNK